jgi:hypothetical protein
LDIEAGAGQPDPVERLRRLRSYDPRQHDEVDNHNDARNDADANCEPSRPPPRAR